ncbi:hypothetical protein CAPTEDRAFT_206785 [Capitella teleta]|uniref:NACHT domain-containing protein n=1 Tax=Capitella teleta TaxID=283909 RepID=R7U5U7_CAPTE|nr:hypothetical protein CAPTEDRAFT_206785 [Capitella teleta]|eukprot:ELU01436.1 hypothetical protein CAPTEDRAFT_206785 [Capitella teleta]
MAMHVRHHDVTHYRSSNKNVRQILARLYSRLRDIDTAPESAPEFVLDSTTFYVPLHLQIEETPTIKKREFSQEEIFISHRDEKSSPAKRRKLCNPKRILVEGDPGMGKTTLCQNLAFRWTQEECTGECKCTPCVHSWSVVIYLTAGMLQGYKNIETAVHHHLLLEISTEELKKTLKSCQTLFIIDSYDEGCPTENLLLQDMVKGTVCANATLILTSRPNHLRDLWKYFDTKLTITGFNSEQQRLYVERFANFKKKYKGKFDELLNLIKDEHYEHEYDLLFGDEEQVKQPHGQHIFMLNGKLHSASLCSNPLNLAIICLLIISDELQNIKSRTELYKCVTKFLVKKASERMKRPKEKIEADIIRPLCRLAFEAFKKNKVYLTNVDLANSGVDAVDVVRSGFLTKNVKVRLLADPVEYFSFSHKTFHKFLAATHMTQTPNDLKDWLKTITAGQWWSERLDSLQLLLFDLLLEYLLVDEAFIVERFSLSQD